MSASASSMASHDTRYKGLCSTPCGSVITTLSLTMNSTMATICATVFALPYQLAAMTTPWLAATMRMPDTMNSRVRMTSATHEGSTPSSMSASRAAATRILSAKGSMNLPKFVTSPRLRARYPSRPSVAASRMKMPAAIQGFDASASAQNGKYSGQGLMMATTNTGTRQMRSSVTTFAGVHSFSCTAPCAIGLTPLPSRKAERRRCARGGSRPARRRRGT